MVKRRLARAVVGPILVLGLVTGQANAGTITLTGSGGSIPDDSIPGFSDTISNTDAGIITDVTLTLFGLTHTWVGDLIATLTFQGTTGTVFYRIGNASPDANVSSNFSGDYAFNDTYLNSIWAAATGGDIPGGNYFATGAGSSAQLTFSSLWNGLSSLGDWTLTIEDVAGGDVGTLGSWRLDITTTSTTAPVPEPATLVLLGLGLAGVGAVGRRRRKGDARR